MEACLVSSNPMFYRNQYHLVYVLLLVVLVYRLSLIKLENPRVCSSFLFLNEVKLYTFSKHAWNSLWQTLAAIKDRIFIVLQSQETRQLVCLKRKLISQDAAFY